MIKTIGNPSKDMGKIRNASPFHNIANISVPILLIHGDRDQRINVNQSRAMFAALKKTAKAVKYIELPNTGHNLKKHAENNDADNDEEDHNDAFKKTLLETVDFFDTHLTP